MNNYNGYKIKVILMTPTFSDPLKLLWFQKANIVAPAEVG